MFSFDLLTYRHILLGHVVACGFRGRIDVCALALVKCVLSENPIYALVQTGGIVAPATARAPPQQWFVLNFKLDFLGRALRKMEPTNGVCSRARVHSYCHFLDSDTVSARATATSWQLVFRASRALECIIQIIRHSSGIVKRLAATPLATQSSVQFYAHKIEVSQDADKFSPDRIESRAHFAHIICNQMNNNNFPDVMARLTVAALLLVIVCVNRCECEAKQ